MTVAEIRARRDEITEELQQVKRKDGTLHCADVVDWAAINTESQLHRVFEWDDTKAAHAYRIWQARATIEAVTVVMTGAKGDPVETRAWVSLPTDRYGDGGYREVVAVLRDNAHKQEYMSDIMSELTRIQRKYEGVAEIAETFAPVFREIDKVRKKLDKKNGKGRKVA